MALTARFVAPLLVVLAATSAAYAEPPHPAPPPVPVVAAAKAVHPAEHEAPAPAPAATAAPAPAKLPAATLKPATPSLDVAVSAAMARKDLLAVRTDVAHRVASGEKPVVVFDIDDTLLTWPKGTTPREVIPGALQYLKSLKDAGAKVVYITGRHEPMRGETIAQLKDNGFPVGPDEKLVLNDTKLKTVDYKAMATRDVVKTLGKPIAVFDNEKENARVFRRELPDASTAVFRLRTTSERPDPSGAGPITVINDFTPALPREIRLGPTAANP